MGIADLNIKEMQVMKNFGMPTLIENRTLADNISLCRALDLSFIELNMNFPEYQIDKIEEVEWIKKRNI